jgi:hypothetical protein
MLSDERLGILLLLLCSPPLLLYSFIDRRPRIIRFYPHMTCVRIGAVGGGHTRHTRNRESG